MLIKCGVQKVDIMKVILSVYNVVYDLLLFHLALTPIQVAVREYTIL
jgi:hypothetical protein